MRFGTAEIYGVLDHFPEIEDYICVGQKLPSTNDEQVLLFLKIANGQPLKESFVATLRNAIRTSLSARHVPAAIYQVNDVPHTVNGKRIENVVRDIVNGKKVLRSTAVNPECLGQYERFAKRGRIGGSKI